MARGNVDAMQKKHLGRMDEQSLRTMLANVQQLGNAIRNLLPDTHARSAVAPATQSGNGPSDERSIGPKHAARVPPKDLPPVQVDSADAPVPSHPPGRSTTNLSPETTVAHLMERE